MDFQAEALYFRAQENGYDYAIVDGHAKGPDFKMHFGARIKLGSEFGCDHWKVWIQFFHYHARNRNEAKGEVFPSWGHPEGGIGPVEMVKSMWRLHMGFADLNLGKCFLISECVELTPYFGVRFVSCRHKSDVEYLHFSEFSMKNKFWGVGPQFGLDGLWRFTSWVGLYSHVAGSLLFGEIYVHQDEHFEVDSIKFFNIYNQVRGIVEMGIGLEIRACFACCTLCGRVGGDLYFLPGQNQLPRFTAPDSPGKFVANQGDLSLIGISIGIAIIF